MELKDLNPAERVALVALVHRSVLSDNALSEGETEEIKLLAEELGEDSYRAVSIVAEAYVKNLDGLREVLTTITRREARELIYGTLLKISLPETVGAGENVVLDLLTDVWAIRPLYEDFPAEDAQDTDEKKPEQAAE
jgi:hypothetical protein